MAKFRAKLRCYVNGILIEGDQEVEFSGKDAEIAKKNQNLELLSDDKRGKKAGEDSEDGNDGRPKLGPAPEKLKLVKQ